LDSTARAIPEAKMTMHAAIWRGAKDDASEATIMDQYDHLGQVWIMFSRGEDPELARVFREHAMQKIMERWPDTRSLPIMPTGAIPHHRDLQLTPSGYLVRRASTGDYGLASNSPLFAPP
jgi:hypothetical protein